MSVPTVAQANLTPGLHEINIVSGGLNRTYDVYVPTSYSANQRRRHAHL
ncbi:MAG: hypothetical protein AAF449_20810 [Myxococcota bacterium]